MTKKFQISVADAEAELDALLDRAEAGETIIITRDGQPVASLSPLPAKKPCVYPDRGFGISDDLAPEA